MRRNRQSACVDTTMPAAWVWSSCAAVLLAACGGGGDAGTADPTVNSTAPSALALSIASADPADSAASAVVQPSFHLAPALLDAPDDADAADNAATAQRAPRQQALDAGLAGLATRGLTVQSLRSAMRRNAASVQGSTGEGSATPQAAAGGVTTYTPAQIRAAYGLPALPASGVTPTAAQAAQLGAGQTIYLIDAMNDPNAAAELAAFNQKFGLSTCSSKTIGASTTLPLAAASAGDGCSFSTVYTTAGGAITNTAPRYDSGWATEGALDVEWAHATAPLARIILIEAPDASTTSLANAVKAANAMGPGVVSMSFGAPEGSWTASLDDAFAGSGMSYLAATGDNSAGVAWPSVSSRVLAVGGTTLSYSGSGARSEAAWAQTGGGISQFTPAPSYQTNSVPGVGTLAHRAVADVAFNANPNTGQFVAIMQPGSSAVSWASVGGTSLSTPQWAGILAVANALRAQAGKPALGAPHAALYGQIGAVPGNYAAAFADITSGADGSCSACSAKIGYDEVSGLGTPNVSGLLSTLTGATVGGSGSSGAATAPVVNAASVSGKVGTPLSYSVAVSSTHAVTYSLSGAPAGLTINASGVLAWAAPVAGSYALTVSAKDSQSGLSGSGVITLSIAAAPLPPVISAPPMNGVAGKPLSGSISVTDPGHNGLGVTISGAAAGMSFSVSGQTIVMSWARPVAGTIKLNVLAVNSLGQHAQATVPVTIAAK